MVLVKLARSMFHVIWKSPWKALETRLPQNVSLPAAHRLAPTESGQCRVCLQLPKDDVHVDIQHFHLVKQLKPNLETPQCPVFLQPPMNDFHVHIQPFHLVENLKPNLETPERHFCMHSPKVDAHVDIQRFHLVKQPKPNLGTPQCPVCPNG